MKVLWFSNSPASGAEYLNLSTLGAGWLSSLDKALSNKVELHIAFYYPKEAVDFLHNGVFYYPICKKNWKWNFVKNKLFGSYIDNEDLSVYLDLIKKIGPDVVHIHGTENAFGAIIRYTSVPVIVSIQGNITLCYQKFLSGIEKKYLSIKSFKFKSITDFPFYNSFNISYRLFRKMKDREIKNLEKCQYIIGRTGWDRRITRIFAPNSEYFEVNEIMRDVFYHNLWQFQNDKKIILHTTNGDSPIKGFETLCHALHLLNKLGIDIEWRVAGISENDLIVTVVKKQLKENYPTKGLVLLGGLKENDLIEKLLEASIYVMPSHIENSPNNLCEAMIIGMPCIATFAGGTGSILSDSKDGILVQDGDPWVLAGAILELQNNPEKAIELGKKARERAIIRHDKENIVNRLFNIYSIIIKNGEKN